MNKLWNALCSFGRWIRLHFDFALLLAAAVEIPRWTVTFLAIHEPLWVGIPLGALLAYATSEGWKAYFADPHRIKLLVFNIASLLAATFVITPVLFSMASAPIDEIDLAALLPPAWLLAWAGVLAVTTFAPLIQLAAVKSTPKEKPTEPTTATTTSNTTTPTPVAPPSESGGHSEAVSATTAPAEQTGATSGQSEGAQPGKGKVSAADRQTIINMKANGMKSVDIADQMQLNESTVRSIIRRATQPAVHTNGATKESA
jgi:DNA-binding CsgD family transcriptional regulator